MGEDPCLLLFERDPEADAVPAQIHIFPEGRVNQESLYPPGGLIRFKWGV